MGLDCVDKIGRLDEGCVGSRVKPGEALPEQVHFQLALLQIEAV